MPDLEALRTHPRRSAPADRYDAIISTARRRRRRTVTVGAGGAAAAVLVSAALVLTSGGTNQSLRIETPAGSATATPVQSAEAEAHGAPPGTASAQRGVDQPGPRAATVPGPGPSARPQEGGDPGRQARSQPMTRSYSGSAATTVCGGIVSQPNPTVPRYCGSVEASRSRAGLLDFALRGSLDAASSRSSTFTFDTAQEVDLTLVRAGRVVWRWSQGQRFAQARHALVVDPGKSWKWSTSWAPTDQNGRALPAGDYEVVGTIRARELGTDNSWRATLTL
jgi:hypothetical protein